MPVTILDGGLGTSLCGDADSSPLWSAAGILDEPEKVLNVHRRFIAAGAHIIETATYQIAYATGNSAGLTRGQTEALMCTAVKVADRARRTPAHLNQQNSLSTRNILSSDSGSRLHGPAVPHVEVALSLGPYGATLSPSCEFTGIYPAPFGPPADDLAVEAALTTWHLERLRVYSSDLETWHSIDLIAFETIPLLCEIRAVRRAMHTLLRELDDSSHSSGDHADDARPCQCPRQKRKRWWISCTFPAPEARFPDPRALEMRDIVRAVLGTEDAFARPDGIGINCAPSSAIARLAQDLCTSVARAVQVEESNRRDSHSHESLPLPWIVLYPNGGEYSQTDARWLANDTSTWVAKVAQAVNVCEAVLGDFDSGHDLVSSPAPLRIVVGGCCNTTAVDITALARIVRPRSEGQS